MNDRRFRADDHSRRGQQSQRLAAGTGPEGAGLDHGDLLFRQQSLKDQIVRVDEALRDDIGVFRIYFQVVDDRRMHQRTLRVEGDGGDLGARSIVDHHLRVGKAREAAFPGDGGTVEVACDSGIEDTVGKALDERQSQLPRQIGQHVLIIGVGGGVDFDTGQPDARTAVGQVTEHA